MVDTFSQADDGPAPVNDAQGDNDLAFPELDLLPPEDHTAAALVSLTPDNPEDLAAFCESFARDGWGEPTLTPSPATAARLRSAQALVRLALEPIRTGRDDLWVKVEQALRVFEDERVGLMTMRARIVQILEERCDRYRQLRTQEDADADLVDETRELAETIRDLTMVHWRFVALEEEHDAVAALFMSNREAIGIAAALSVRVGAFGDETVPRARDVYRKAKALVSDDPGEGGPVPKLGRRARRGKAAG
jgi:hypothetical protein